MRDPDGTSEVPRLLISAGTIAGRDRDPSMKIRAFLPIAAPALVAGVLSFTRSEETHPPQHQGHSPDLSVLAAPAPAGEELPQSLPMRSAAIPEGEVARERSPAGSVPDVASVTFAGTVYLERPWGMPVSGAKVRATVLGSEEELGATITDSDGAFSLR